MAPKKKVGGSGKPEEDEAREAKIQDEIARYIRFNCPTNSTLFEGNEVHYFSGSKAIDTLLDSKKFGTNAIANEKYPVFHNRKEAQIFIQKLMNAKLFFRAKKLVPKKKEDKEKENKKKKEEESVTETEGEEKEEPEKEKEKEDKEKEKEKKKKKIKLIPHNIQTFNDDKDVYVWVFDPTPLYKKVIGLLMVLGTIVGCLFPLWPMWLRQAVYYLSMACLGFFGAVLVTAILRTILFGIIWLVTGGQHHLWIFPNLLEDCAILDSFKPFYTYEYRPRGQKPTTEKKEKQKKKKEKDSDAEDNNENNDALENTDLGASAEKGDEVAKESGAEKSASDDEEGSISETDPDNPSGSGSEDISESGSSKEATVRRRKVRRDDDFVHVK